MANGKKTGGRIAGTPNKLSGVAKDNVAAVFVRLGGTPAMAKWAKENQTQFYQIYAKLLPLEVAGDADAPLRVITSVHLVALDGNSADTNTK